MSPRVHTQSPDEMIRELQQELADTNREVLALTLELDKHVEQLRAAEERYRRLAENAPDVIFRCELDPGPVCSFMSPRVTVLTGYSPEEFYVDAGILFNLVHLEDRPLLDDPSREDSTDASTVTLRWVHRNGNIVWIEQHNVKVRDGRGRVVAIESIARDVTSRRRLEEQFLQAQKMEAIGQLTGGVAHDFNNLLTVINCYSEQALGTLRLGDPLHKEMAAINDAGERAATLTRQLLAFSRQQILAPQVLDLNEIVSSIDSLLRRVIGEDVDLTATLDSSLGSVHADPGQIEQVIMNLAVNARDAMPDGGRLLIETGNVELDEAYKRQHSGTVPGAYVMLAVSDTGCGMDEETQQRVFEPFFTTKPVGRGTGLGLSTVFGIVQQSGGAIWLYSEPGHGTTFKIYFPRISGRAEPRTRPVNTIPVSGSETILLIEDQDAVRELIRTVLTRAGYQVLAGRGGSEALRLCESHRGDIDLLITDVIMPQMNGRELAARITALRPQIKLLFTSGYTDNAILQHGVLDARAPFLQKPFTPASLTEKVREALGSASR